MRINEKLKRWNYQFLGFDYFNYNYKNWIFTEKSIFANWYFIFFEIESKIKVRIYQ